MTKYEQYVDDIINNRVTACSKTKQAVRRHANDLKRNEFPFYFDKDEADKTIAFVESLEMFEGSGAGKLLILEPWQAFIVASLFGWKRKDTGKRRFKKSFVFVGRGNGKSPLMSAIALISLIKDNGGQIYSIATNHSQASIILKWCSNYVQRNAKLSEIIEVYQNSLMYRPKSSILKPLSKSFKSFDGFNPSVIIADEVAAMPDCSLLDVMETALHKREDSLLLMITTANFISTQSPGYLEYDYSTKLLNGTITDDRYFTVIYELDPTDDWTNDTLYVKANPASFIQLDELKHARDEARNAPHKEKGFRTKNLNQWLIGSNDAWLSDEKWKPSIDNYEKYKEYLTDEKLKGRICTIGADLSDRRDLSVYTIAFHISEINAVYLKHRVYIPQAALATKTQNDNQMFNKWYRDGIVTLCEGEYIDKQQIAEDILTDIGHYKPKSFSYDPYSSHEIIEAIQEHIDCIPVPQSMAVLSEPTKDFEELILSSKIIDPNPIARWCVNNTRVYQSNKLVKLQKHDKDSTQRIDVTIASIMAVWKLREFVKLEATVVPAIDFRELSKILYG